MQVRSHHTIDELERLAAAEKHATRHLKLRSVILARRGWTAPQVAEALGKGRRTIQQWVGDYNRDALDGLTDGRGGNHRYLDDALVNVGLKAWRSAGQKRSAGMTVSWAGVWVQP